MTTIAHLKRPVASIVVLLGLLLLALALALPAASQTGADDEGGGGAGGGTISPPGTPTAPTVPRRNPIIVGERIIDFASRIEVEKSGAVTVTETIRVNALGARIRRGIFRDLPTRYRDRLNNRVIISLDILEILRDGRKEDWHTEGQSNGTRIYLGHKDRFLSRGQYTYIIKYRMTRMVGFFDGFDEIYWNVTGNGWDFTIDHARAEIVLPPGARVTQSAGYTGAQGASGRDFTKTTAAHGNLVFETTRALRPREGLTVAVGFTKGVVTPPAATAKAMWFFADNLSALAALFGLFVALIYYMAAWWLLGRDPKKGVIIPLYEPPHGISPAAARFIMRMGFDNKAFAAAVVNMAVKGYLTITEDKKKKFALETTGNEMRGLSQGERKIAGKFFGGARKSKLKLEQSNHSTIAAAITALRTYLKAEFEIEYFITNLRYVLVGLGIMLLAVLGTMAGADDKAAAFFIALWLSLWSVGVFFLGAQLVKAWAAGKVGTGIFLTLFSLPFFAGEVAAIWFLLELVQPLAVAGLVAIGAANALFYHLMKAPTLLGRRIMDHLEGFKMYLSVAEKDRMNLMNPPAETPELFEKFLPYALALDVEQRWSERFADVLARARMADGSPYHPYWYHGAAWSSLGAAGLASGLGSSLSSAISSSSTAPGSSSGSGGGGFSGGGGGGGGGGGW